MSRGPTLPLAIIAFAALLIVVFGAYGLGRMSASSPSADGAHAEEHEDHDDHEGEEEHLDEVELSAERISTAGIMLETVRSGGLEGRIQAQGRVVASPGGQAILTARAPGSISRIAKRLGEPVRVGETVAVIESAEAASITAQRLTAQAEVTAARQRLEREQSLYEQGVSARQDLEAAEADLAVAQAQAASASARAAAARVAEDGRSVLVTSPIAGNLIEADAIVGAFVEPGQELFHVASARDLQVEAAVSPADARRIRPGDPAEIRIGADLIPATVVAVTPGVSGQTRLATVLLSASGGALQPGMLVGATISPTAVGGEGMVVPEAAVQAVEGRASVFVRNEHGFVVRPVEVGARSGGLVEIISGLAGGEQIAVEGAFLLKSELGASEATHQH